MPMPMRTQGQPMHGGPPPAGVMVPHGQAMI